MGWWTQNEQGHSFAVAEGEPMFWGDSVADIIDSALQAIEGEFLANYRRKPTKEELRAGLEFSISIYGEEA